MSHKCPKQMSHSKNVSKNVSINMSLEMSHSKYVTQNASKNVPIKMSQEMSKSVLASLEPQDISVSAFWLNFLNRGTLGWCKFSLLVSLQLSNHEDLSSFSLFKFLLSSLHLSSDPNFRLIYWWQSWNQRRQISSLHYHNHQHFI